MLLDTDMMKVIYNALDGSVPGTVSIARMGVATKTMLALHVAQKLALHQQSPRIKAEWRQE